jgi:hypothetical protein
LATSDNISLTTQIKNIISGRARRNAGTLTTVLDFGNSMMANGIGIPVRERRNQGKCFAVSEPGVEAVNAGSAQVTMIYSKVLLIKKLAQDASYSS